MHLIMIISPTRVGDLSGEDLHKIRLWAGLDEICPLMRKGQMSSHLENE
jgi:hypothetical protein